ncbi:MAG: hypothetical protein K6U04_06980 [Armatimonadetes bacterium]|nr:hypothetical protein [Armatimonadota bacterium]
MAKAEIYGGICGFTTLVTAVKGAGKGREMEVAVRLDSECPSWQKVAEEIGSLKPFQELFSLPHEGQLYGVARRFVRHPACPVPAGILKAVEVAAGLALPRDATIKVAAED